MKNRRAFLLASSAGVLALGGCTTLKNFFNNITPAEVGQVVLSDLGLIKNGATGLLAALTSLNILSASTSATVSADLTSIVAFVNTVATGMAQSAAQPIVAQIEATLMSVVTALQGINLPTTVEQILAAMQILMPVIETAVGILIKTSAPKVQDVDWARSILATA